MAELSVTLHCQDSRWLPLAMRVSTAWYVIRSYLPRFDAEAAQITAARLALWIAPPKVTVTDVADGVAVQ